MCNFKYHLLEKASPTKVLSQHATYLLSGTYALQKISSSIKKSSLRILNKFKKKNHWDRWTLFMKWRIYGHHLGKLFNFSIFECVFNFYLLWYILDTLYILLELRELNKEHKTRKTLPEKMSRIWKWVEILILGNIVGIGVCRLQGIVSWFR